MPFTPETACGPPSYEAVFLVSFLFLGVPFAALVLVWLRAGARPRIGPDRPLELFESARAGRVDQAFFSTFAVVLAGMIALGLLIVRELATDLAPDLADALMQGLLVSVPLVVLLAWRQRVARPL